MDLSIIIITFNSAHCIERCIQDAQHAMDANGLKGEICLFENGSVDGTGEIVRKLEEVYQNLKVIYASENKGTTVSRNAAMEKSTGQYLLVLDSDAFITPECLQGLYHFLQQHKDYGMVGPKLTYASGNFQLSYDDFPTMQRKFERLLFLKSIEKTPQPKTQQSDVDYLISACWLFRREVYEQVGPLDENIFYAPEDVDYCIRIWKAGYKIGYLPTVEMVHDAQELSRSFKLNKFQFLHAKGLLYYFSKHHYFFNLAGVRQRIMRAVDNRISASKSSAD